MSSSQKRSKPGAPTTKSDPPKPWVPAQPPIDRPLRKRRLAHVSAHRSRRSRLHARLQSLSTPHSMRQHRARAHVMVVMPLRRAPALTHFLDCSLLVVTGSHPVAMASIQAQWPAILDFRRHSSSACTHHDRFKCASCAKVISPFADVFMGLDRSFCSNHCRLSAVSGRAVATVESEGRAHGGSATAEWRVVEQ